MTTKLTSLLLSTLFVALSTLLILAVPNQDGYIGATILLFIAYGTSQLSK